jgi:prefoldin subunit 5
MAKIPNYKKDEETGAVIFQDATAYAQRKKVIVKTKLAKKAEKDSKRSINSMKREIKDLKKNIALNLNLEARIRNLEGTPVDVGDDGDATDNVNEEEGN